MEVVLLVGAQPYPLLQEEARWFEDRIRSTCVDDLGRAPDAEAVACLQLAEELVGEHDEPIELGRSHAVGLTEYVLSPAAAAEHDLGALHDALIRFRG